jgi:hypothetical protein
MRLNRSILIISTITAASGAAFAQTDTENPPSVPPDAQVQPTPETAPPVVEPPPVANPAPVVVPVPAYAAPTADVGPTSSHMKWMPTTGFGVGLFVGGGVTDYTGSVARADTNTGGSWTGRVTLGTRSIVGLEGSYIGGANSLHALGGNATLVRNGIEGVLRINLPIMTHDSLLEPYIFGGAGWNGYRVTNYNSITTASVTTGTDNTVSVPLGVGFTYGYHGFLADLRYTIRPTYDQSILVNQTSSALTNWDAGAMLGYEF